VVQHLGADHSGHGLVLVAATCMITGVNLLQHMDVCVYKILIFYDSMHSHYDIL
jgi:hypothetical protein